MQLSTGGLFLALAALHNTIPARPWAGALLLATAVLQGKLALKANRQKRAARGNPFRRTSFWRTMFVGLVCCYALALALGPNPGTPYWFVAAISVWYTLWLLPIAANPRVLELWKRITQQKIPRKAAAAFTTATALLVTTEIGLRGYAWLLDQSWVPAAPLNSFAAASMLPGSAPLLDADSRFHVAIVGDEITLGGIHNDGALSQLEVLVPGLRVTNFSLPNVGPREYAADLSRRVLACRPNLVLTFVSPADDVLAESAGSDLFDWRSLAIARSFVAHRASSQSPSSLCHSAGHQLAVCRTPTDSGTHRRWQKTLKHLDRLVRDCHRQQVEVALVVVPGEFQLNGVLCETLCRRMGLQLKDLDLELPQRRLATFAGDRQVPYVDLLPHLRTCEVSPYERETRQWNTAGTQIALQTIGGWLQSRYGEILPATAQMTQTNR